jgi:hypothetical protein
MATWNGALWNSGALWGAAIPPLPPVNKSKPHKKMKRQEYYPVRQPEQPEWLNNFAVKLALYGPTIPLAAAWLEWDAAKNLIGLREPWFVGVPYAEYLRAVSQNGESQLPAPLREANANATWFHAFEIAGSAKLPQAAQLAPLAHQHLPAALINDLSASWREWPMKYRPALP